VPLQGYHDNAAATAAAFVGDGWLDTGDLGYIAPRGVPHSAAGGCVVLAGRARDTIVLTSGENVEPQPLEDLITASPRVKFAIVIGQGHRALGALGVPDSEALDELAAAQGGGQLGREEVEMVLRGEVAAALGQQPRWERVAAVAVLEEPFRRVFTF
jgi:long-chain acyl-CoA synthetase